MLSLPKKEATLLSVSAGSLPRIVSTPPSPPKTPQKRMTSPPRPSADPGTAAAARPHREPPATRLPPPGKLPPIEHAAPAADANETSGAVSFMTEPADRVMGVWVTLVT